jgi:pyruvate-ferredoxin/flavodoxin oxidoreductase
MRLTIDAQAEQARALVTDLAGVIGEQLASEIVGAVQHDEPTIFEQRNRVEEMKRRLKAYMAAPSEGTGVPLSSVRRLMDLADTLVKKSVWIVGGDGWAYDIGYGGLDHVLASDKNVNVLVLDTEVYSNTGGQASKATPRGAVARFAAGGKNTGKKDLGLLAMMYGHVYVAHVALGASDTQTVKSFLEAEAYDGPSIIIAYAHCIAHGLEVKNGLTQQSRAVASGHWPLYRYDPRGASSGKFPLTLDSKPPKIRMSDYTMEETRYSVLKKMDRAAAERLAALAQRDVDTRWQIYEQLAAMRLPS